MQAQRGVAPAEAVGERALEAGAKSRANASAGHGASGRFSNASVVVRGGPEQGQPRAMTTSATNTTASTRSRRGWVGRRGRRNRGAARADR